MLNIDYVQYLESKKGGLTESLINFLLYSKFIAPNPEMKGQNTIQI